jgi:hypothetical protein
MAKQLVIDLFAGIVLFCISVAPSKAQNMGKFDTVPIPGLNGGTLGWSIDQVGDQVNLSINGGVVNGVIQDPAPLGGPAACFDMSNRLPAPGILSAIVGFVIPVGAQVWAGGCSLRFCSSPATPSTGVQGVNFDAFVYYEDQLTHDRKVITQFIDHSRPFWTSVKCQ